MRLEATPVATLEPDRLQVNSYPALGEHVLHHVGDSGLPVGAGDANDILGAGILPKKSGHKMIAQLPGIEVPLRPMSFITLEVALANSSAK